MMVNFWTHIFRLHRTLGFKQKNCVIYSYFLFSKVACDFDGCDVLVNRREELKGIS